MMKLRSGYFLIYKGLQCKLLPSTEPEIISSDKRSLELGFSQYPNTTTYHKHINKSDISTAFEVITKAKYKGHIFQVTENKVVVDDDKITLFLNNLDFEAYDMFGFNYRNDNANILVQVKDLESIWEERKPLLDFIFNIDPIYYIKGSA